MSKKTFFCEQCGVRVKYIRKALKNRNEIVNLIIPHECDMENTQLRNITDSDEPLGEHVAFTGTIKDGGLQEAPPDMGVTDRRKDKITSGAPQGLQDAVKRGNL